MAQRVKDPPAIQEMCVPSLGQKEWRENGNLFQYPCPENPTDRGAWRDAVRRVTESDTTSTGTAGWSCIARAGSNGKLVCTLVSPL